MKDQGWSLSSHWRNLNRYLPGEYWKPPDYAISEQVVLSLSHRSCSALYGFIKYPFSQSEKKKRMTTALRSDAGSGWDCFEVPSNKYSDVSTIMERLHQESFRQTHQNDRKVLLLGRTQWRVLFMSSTGRDWASGSHIFCMTGVSQILSDISSLLFCCVGATLVHPLDWTSQLPWTGAHVLGLMCETSTDLFLLSLLTDSAFVPRRKNWNLDNSKVTSKCCQIWKSWYF